MKKLIIISLILAAGLTAYPQNTRSSREAKSSKSKSSQVATRSSSGSKSKQVKSSASAASRPKATQARSTASRSAVSRSSGTSRSTAGRSSSGASEALKSRSTSSRSTSGSSRSNAGISSGSRSTKAYSGSEISRSRTSRSSGGAEQNSAVRSSNTKSTYPAKINTVERSRSNNQANRSSSGSSFNRSNRGGSKAYVSNDGREFRHQNDEVFARTRYRVDYRDVNDLRRSRDYVIVRDNYHNWYSHRYVRRMVVHNHFYSPLSIEVRRHRYPYRVPVHLDLCWTPNLHHSFVYYYPLHERWNMHYGEYIETASSYEAINYVGSVKRVYGKVEEVFYSPEDRTYTLYFGAQFPYHDFSVVVPRDVAKNFSWSPSWYFEDEHIWVVGLIEMWEGKPEIVIHDEQQIRRY